MASPSHVTPIVELALATMHSQHQNSKSGAGVVFVMLWTSVHVSPVLAMVKAPEAPADSK
jgi:hypothetical protein